MSRGGLCAVLAASLLCGLIPPRAAAATEHRISRDCVPDIREVRGNSMAPFIAPGTRIAIFSTGCVRNIRRGDLVTFVHGSAPVPLLKRVVGVPGDNFHMEREDSGAWLINIGGQRVRNASGELYRLRGGPARVMQIRERRHRGRIPRGHFLVMGEKTGGSLDSSRLGMIDGERITGLAIRVVQPPGSPSDQDIVPESP